MSPVIRYPRCSLGPTQAKEYLAAGAAERDRLASLGLWRVDLSWLTQPDAASGRPVAIPWLPPHLKGEAPAPPPEQKARAPLRPVGTLSTSEEGDSVASGGAGALSEAPLPAASEEGTAGAPPASSRPPPRRASLVVKKAASRSGSGGKAENGAPA